MPITARGWQPKQEGGTERERRVPFCRRQRLLRPASERSGGVGEEEASGGGGGSLKPGGGFIGAAPEPRWARLDRWIGDGPSRKVHWTELLLE